MVRLDKSGHRITADKMAWRDVAEYCVEKHAVV